MTKGTNITINPLFPQDAGQALREMIKTESQRPDPFASQRPGDVPTTFATTKPGPAFSPQGFTGIRR